MVGGLPNPATGHRGRALEPIALRQANRRRDELARGKGDYALHILQGCPTTQNEANCRRWSVMTSWKQIAANRRNALKSTGPITEKGKLRSRCNAVRHGLTAETVISALEDAGDYKAF